MLGGGRRGGRQGAAVSRFRTGPAPGQRDHASPSVVASARATRFCMPWLSRRKLGLASSMMPGPTTSRRTTRPPAPARGRGGPAARLPITAAGSPSRAPCCAWPRRPPARACMQPVVEVRRPCCRLEGAPRPNSHAAAGSPRPAAARWPRRRPARARSAAGPTAMLACSRGQRENLSRVPDHEASALHQAKKKGLRSDPALAKRPAIGRSSDNKPLQAQGRQAALRLLSDGVPAPAEPVARSCKTGDGRHLMWARAGAAAHSADPNRRRRAAP